MEKSLRKKIFWNEAAKGGLIVGALFGVSSVLTYKFSDNPNAWWVFIMDMVIIFTQFSIGLRFAKKNTLTGLTFQRALAFMTMVLIFSGILFGAVNFVIFNNDADYAYKFAKLGSEMLETDVNDKLMQTMTNPVTLIFSSIFSLLIRSFFPALIISAIIKRPAAIK